MLKPYIAKVLETENLSSDEAFSAMEIIMTGEATDAQIGGYLVGLRMKGETIEEIVGSAQAMRSVAKTIDPNVDAPLIDIVGTGGDGAHTINVSTTAAFVIAGAGYAVAKHGNRAASSKSGSADVLEALGVNLNLAPAHVQRCIEKIGIGFMFAPNFHPAMKHVIGPRRQLGQRSIFNLLGPLTNPAHATHQLIGVYDGTLIEPLAHVLNELGVKGAMVVHGEGGLDELTTSGVNQISELRNGLVNTYEFSSNDLGLRAATLEDLRGGEPEDNAEIMRAILSGEDQSSRRDVILLNAAAAMATIGQKLDIALEKAKKSIDSGAAIKKLDKLILQTQAGASV